MGGVVISDLRMETTARWQWNLQGRLYEMAPKSFDIEVFLESDAPLGTQVALLQAAKKGCFVEQTLSIRNTITHRIRTEDGIVRVA